MACKHLYILENELKNSDILIRFNGQAWTENCRQWIYYDCYFDTISLRKRITFDDCIVDYDYSDIKVGSEEGFFCTECKDAIIGIHKSQISNSTYTYK